ncbi:hypothetical protein [Pectobacterium actinidiae]|nr:hypothetical protein [Pectobacterium actinidiae]
MYYKIIKPENKAILPQHEIEKLMLKHNGNIDLWKSLNMVGKK